jgi:adenylate kinase
VEHPDGLGSQLAGILRSGGLVPDETVNALVEERIALPDCAKGFILDGYPRTVNQAAILSGLLESHGVAAALVHLKVDYNVIVARLAGRRQCPACGALYSLAASAPTVPEVCKDDGTKLVIRDDDREEVVTERLKAYHRQTAPVLEYFKNAGVPVWDVDGAAPEGPQEIARRIRSLIEEKFVS